MVNFVASVGFRVLPLHNIWIIMIMSTELSSIGVEICFRLLQCADPSNKYNLGRIFGVGNDYE